MAAMSSTRTPPARGTSGPEDEAAARALGERPLGRLVRVLVALGLLVLGWWMLRLGAHDASLVSWDCGGGSCATNDFAGAAPSLGGLAVAAAAVLGATLVGWLAPALALVVASLALLVGWRGAVADGLASEASVRVPVGIAAAVLVLALAGTVVALVAVLRRAGTLARLAGRRSTWARVTDYATDAQGGVLGTVHFDDDRGVRHAVRTTVPRRAFAIPARALYDPARPDDPERLRVALPAQPAMAATRQARERALRVRLPLPGDDLPGGREPGAGGTDHRPAGAATADGDAPDVSVALARLAALHAAGSLSDDEFAAAKAAVLRGR
jgi:hypothetical protein